MDRIRREIHGEREIIIVDFSDCKEDKMIEVMMALRTTLIQGGKPELVLGIFNGKSFLTPGFMEAFRKEKRTEAIPFIKRQAIVGFTDTQNIILKGYNFFYDRDISSFQSREAAINFLLSD